MEATSFTLGNPGDVFVIPAPGYPYYSKDLGSKSKLIRYDLQTHHNIEDLKNKTPRITVQQLEKIKWDLKQKGQRFRILLLTSPDNPTGCIYSISQLTILANWCIKNKIHMIVNEIYAMS